MQELRLILWIDAKFTHFEKTFAKISLSGTCFPGHRSRIMRWIDLMGHETAILEEEFASEILVLPPSLPPFLIIFS